MLDIQSWLDEYMQAVQSQFQNRIWLIGLQGSYARGEAGPSSDIDVVFILDQLSSNDLENYGRLLDTLPNRELICGFVSGRPELENWDKSDLFQFCHDTAVLLGSLDPLLQTISPEDVKRTVKLGACNLYHECVHNMLHEKSVNTLIALYKSAVFTLRAIAYLQNGVFAQTQQSLFSLLKPEDQVIIEHRFQLKCNPSLANSHFKDLSWQLAEWASQWIKR